MSNNKEKVTCKFDTETYKKMKAADIPMTEILRKGVDMVFSGNPETNENAVQVELQPEIKTRIDGHTEDRQAFIRSAIAEKLARESNHKRHLNANESISMNFTDFEARFIGDALWDMGDRMEGVGWTQVDNEYKWMARRFHAECKTRHNKFGDSNE